MSPEPKKTAKTYLARDEYERLLEQANRAGLSLSSFIKKVCLGQPVRDIADKQAVLELVRSKADLGRLGGLLKMALSEPGQLPVSREELRDLLKSIEATQRALAADFHKVSQSLLKNGQ